MINLRIPQTTALILLTERMKYELEFRKRNGTMPENADLFRLSYKELLELAEIAAFDMVAFLPLELLIKENNIVDIITKAIKSLSQVFGKEEFNSYDKKRCERLINPLLDYLRNMVANNAHVNN